MEDIFLLEPASKNKKRYLGQKLMPVGVEDIPEQKEVKFQLRELRNFSINNREKLIEQFIAIINQKENIELSLAATADQAVNRIKNLCGGFPLVINKSAVVLRELYPAP